MMAMMEYVWPNHGGDVGYMVILKEGDGGIVDCSELETCIKLSHLLSIYQ